MLHQLAKRAPLMSSSSSSPAPAPPHVVEDCLGIVQLLSDGTVTRSDDYSSISLMCNVPTDLPVQWKDVVYDAGRGLRLRMYAPTSHSGEEGKLPVLVYFHGGGFCIASFELPNFHAGALRLAGELPAVVLSANYRLAPEHRLPAAHDDAESVLSWLRGHAAASASASASADPWLAALADFDRVFVCGDSCGGNIAHHLTIGCGSGKIELDPARLVGCVMLWPYFGGEEKMPSEAPPPEGDASSSAMSIVLFDQMWRLALPAGATRDHPAANPFGPESPPLDGVVFPPVLIVDPEQDVLRDRVADYAARMEAMGKRVELVKFEGQGHGFFVLDPMSEASGELVRVVRRFVYGG